MLPASIMESISDGYDKLWQEFIKPQRAVYSVEDLGPSVASAHQIEIDEDICFIREDFRLPLDQHRGLVASFFYPTAAHVASV